VTLRIVVFTVLASLAAFYNGELMRKLIFNPYVIRQRNQWHRFITSGFIHLDFMHLAVNMLVLYSFGRAVEYHYAWAFGDQAVYYYVLLYLGALLFSVTPTYAKHKNNPGYNALGASGAVSAVLFTAVLFEPLNKVYLMGLLPIPGILAAVGYVVYEYYAGKKGGDNINHDAHLWGAGFGVAFTLLLKPSLLLRFFEKLTDF
jgi:membrane associated rhomboid family serine protease